MRRKSSRNASKAAEKARESSPAKKSRRHSKRRRRSSSRSSSENSNDGDTKAVPTTQHVEQEHAESAAPALTDESKEQPVWMVTQSSAPSGEIQKLKICLAKPSASPEKNEHSARRRRNKSGSQTESEVASPDDKSVRKLRHRGSPGANHDEQEDHDEEVEDKGKGKSKNKHKSKSEKAPEIQSQQMQTKHDLSENVQVTPQSPQATIDIRVDNESVSTIENETVDVNEAGTNSVPESANVPEINDIKNAVEETSDKTTETSSECYEQPAESSKQLVDSCDSEGNFRGFDSSEQKEVKNLFNEKASEVVAENLENQDTKATPYADTDTIGKEEAETEATKNAEAESESMPNLETENTTITEAETTENLQTEAQIAQKETTKNLDIVAAEIEEDESAQIVETKLSQITESEASTSMGNNTSLNCELLETTNEKDIPNDFQSMEQRNEEKSVNNNIEVVESVAEGKQEVIENKDVESSGVVETMQHEPSNTEPSVESNTEDEAVQKEYTANKCPLANKEELNTKSNVVEEPQPYDEDSKSMDVVILSNISTPKEEIKFSLTKPSSANIIEGMEKPNSEFFEMPSKQQRKRKWGNSLVSLQLMGPFLYTIDFETIKRFCPDLQLLEENELKLDIRDTKDRRKSSEQKERRPERKVSVEHKYNSSLELKKIEPQSSLSLSVTEEPTEPEVDNSNIIAMNRKISIVDDTASKLKPPPSPAKNPVSEVLFITNLVRPFTLKQLKELLERTGKIRENGFWTDRIKSKCYVYYDTIEEAEATRNALHGVNWPIGNGKKLIIDYATPEDLEKARNPAPPPPPPVMPEQQISEKENQVPEKKLKQQEPERVAKDHERRKNEMHVREWDIGKADLHRMRSRSRERDCHNDRNDRRKPRRTPTPVDDFIARKRKKEEDIPQKLMDDLFRKTRTTPSIYWLPLTPEEIATKQQQRLLRMAEHKRRMEESSRNRSDYGRGAPYRRRYD